MRKCQIVFESVFYCIEIKFNKNKKKISKILRMKANLYEARV